MRNKIFFLSVFLACVFYAQAQPNWKSKDFDKWDRQDVETILNNSDYVQNKEVRLQFEGRQTVAAGAYTPKIANSGGTISEGASRTRTNTVGQGGIQPAVDFTFTLRLRSSLAVRLALIRQNQLETDTSKMTAKELELFNRRQRGLYDCPACAENYVVTLTSASKENKNYDAVYTSFGNAQFNDIKRYIYLQNEKGEKRELVNFTAPKAPGEEAIFFFRRFDESGNPLFTRESKNIILNLTNNKVNTVTNYKFETAPLVVGGRVDF